MEVELPKVVFYIAQWAASNVATSSIRRIPGSISVLVNIELQSVPIVEEVSTDQVTIHGGKRQIVHSRKFGYFGPIKVNG